MENKLKREELLAAARALDMSVHSPYTVPLNKLLADAISLLAKTVVFILEDEEDENS